MQPASTVATRGDFIRVRDDHAERGRAGKDGMVMEVFPEGPALIFGCDRYCEFQDVVCVGPEMWNWAELDMNSIDPVTHPD
jgi:hypothetical protein